MKFLFLILLATFLVAGDISISAWNVLNLSSKSLHKKDSAIFRDYFSKDFDIFVLTEVLDKKVLSHLTNKKVVYSERLGKSHREYIAFIVSNRYKSLKIYSYYDTHDTFLRDPSMLVLNGSFGIIGVHLVYGRKKSHGNGLTKREVRGLKNLLRYFSKKSGIPEDRIIIAGDFNLKPFEIESLISKDLRVLIQKATTISTSKKRIAANSYDHFIVHRNLKVLASRVNYSIIKDKSIQYRKKFRKYVSDHYPIEINLKY